MCLSNLSAHLWVLLYCFTFSIRVTINTIALKEKKIYFMWNSDLYGEGETGRVIFHWLFHSPDSRNGQRWANPKPGVFSGSLVFCMGSRTWAIPLFQAISQELDQKWRSWKTQRPCEMPTLQARIAHEAPTAPPVQLFLPSHSACHVSIFTCPVKFTRSFVDPSRVNRLFFCEEPDSKRFRLGDNMYGLCYKLLSSAGGVCK